MMLSVMAVSLRAVGTATPLASGAVSTQNRPLVMLVAVVAAMNRVVAPVTPSAIVAVAPVRVPVQVGTRRATRTSPVTVKTGTEPTAPVLAAPSKVIVLETLRR